MNILLLASRFPWPAYSGDRLRTTIWLDALAGRARVALVAPGGEIPPDAAFSFHPAKRSLTNGIRAVARLAGEGLPATTLLTAGYDWTNAIAHARRELGPFDATIVILSRLDPWVRSHAEGRRILDAIDSLGNNTLERARAATWLAPFWNSEARRVGRAESDAIRHYDAVLVVSDEEASLLGATTISNGVVVAPIDMQKKRTFDFAFWGRLSYFANADAARVLIHETWPAIRALAPESRLAIGGSHVPRDIARDARQAGIELVTPVRDMPSFIRDAKIALVPMRFGSGVQTKILEAAEGGCAIASTAHALRGLEPLARHATIANDPASLASAAVALLRDEPRRIAAATALREAAEQHYARTRTHERMLAILERGRAAA
jgi:glycosyltransferase involved in cell wall biosynthesis